jgi:hypothetical protein
MTDKTQISAALRVIQQQREDISIQINNSFESLVVNSPKSKLPESVFVEHFLPFFSGKLDDPRVQGRDVLTDWVSIAGTPMAEVEILDEQQNVLFAVPALYDTNIISLVQPKAGNAISDIYREFELRKAGVPVAANNFLTNALLDKSQQLTNPEQNVTVQRWNAIYERYNATPANTGTAPSGNSDPSVDVIYD